MKSQHSSLKPENLQLISLKQSGSHSHIFDILLLNPIELLQYDFVELDFHFYPYSREINSSKYVLTPYEEQVDGASHSSYDKIKDPYGIYCGLGIGLAILATVGNLNPQDLAGVESIVTLALAYVGGKDHVRPMLDKRLIQISKKYPVQWKEWYYNHQAKGSNISTNYIDHARKIRLSVERLLPKYMSLEIGSNSCALRVKIPTEQMGEKIPLEQIKAYDDRGDAKGSKTYDNMKNKVNSFNLGAFHFGKDDAEQVLLLDELKKLGFQFGVHVKLGHKLFFVDYKHELLQTVFKDAVGILVNGKEVANTIEVRKTFTIGRLKYYQYRGTIPGILVGKELNP